MIFYAHPRKGASRHHHILRAFISAHFATSSLISTNDMILSHASRSGPTTRSHYFACRHTGTIESIPYCRNPSGLHRSANQLTLVAVGDADPNDNAVTGKSPPVSEHLRTHFHHRGGSGRGTPFIAPWHRAGGARTSSLSSMARLDLSQEDLRSD